MTPALEMPSQEQIIWQPQPGPQTYLISCPVPEILIGGARGGGKTQGELGKYLVKSLQYKSHFNGIIFRQEMPQADDLIEEAKEIYLRAGATWQEQKRQFQMPGGGILRFRPLESEDDARKYQGQNLTDCNVQECGNYSDPAPIDKLWGALRSKHGVPCQLLLDANPGGPGHTWLYERFIEPAPGGLKIITVTLPNGTKHYRVYIPARVKDNQLLLKNDPEYINRLYLVGSPQLVRAWLDGDWQVRIEGAFFPELSDRHIIQPFEIPKHWPRYGGYDWGFHSDFAHVWGAVSSGKDDAGNAVPYRQGAIIIYRESHGRLVSNVDQARTFRELSSQEPAASVFADPSIWANKGGPSVHDEFEANGYPMHRADNHRLSGWSQIRMRLSNDLIYFFSTCPYVIQQLRALPIDKRNAADCDTTAPDHSADACRYLCKARVVDPTWTAPPQEVRLARVPIAAYVKQKRAHSNRPRL